MHFERSAVRDENEQDVIVDSKYDMQVCNLLVWCRQVLASLIQRHEPDCNSDTFLLFLDILKFLFSARGLSIGIQDSECGPSNVAFLIPLAKVKIRETLLALWNFACRAFSRRCFFRVARCGRLRSVCRRGGCPLVVKSSQLQHRTILELQRPTEPAVRRSLEDKELRKTGGIGLARQRMFGG